MSNDNISENDKILDRLLSFFEEKGINQAKFIEITGYSSGQASAIYNRKASINRRLVKSLCAHFLLSEEWLLAGEGEPERFKSSEIKIDLARGYGPIPVVSMLQAGDGVYWEDTYPAGYGHKFIDRPADVQNDPHAIAFEIRGQSMSPKYEEGEIVVVSSIKEVMNGDCAAIRLRTGEVMIKRVKFANGFVFLESINPAFDPIVVMREDIEFFRKIVWKKEKE